MSDKSPITGTYLFGPKKYLIWKEGLKSFTYPGQLLQSWAPLESKVLSAELEIVTIPFPPRSAQTSPMPAPTQIEKDLPLYNVIGDSVTSSAMATPSLLQIDDRNPLVFYSPNSSWTRGGAASDFDGTSTFTATTGASATLTFTGMPHFMSPSFF